MPRVTGGSLEAHRREARARVYDAFARLMYERGYDAISIQDITDRAGLRRATFYLHYRDKDELLLGLLRDTLDELMQQMAQQAPPSYTAETQRAEDELIFRHVQAHANLYRAILSGQGAAEITRGIRDFVAGRIREHCARSYAAPDLTMPLEVVANYLAAVKLNMVIWWLDRGLPYPPEQMAAMCARLTLFGAAPVLALAGPV